MNAVVPDGLTLSRFRVQQWGNLPLIGAMPQVLSLLAHAPRAGRDFLDMHELDERQRIDRLIAACTVALKEGPHLASRLRPIVPVLAQEKLRRNGLDPNRAATVIMSATLSNKNAQSHAEGA